MATGVERQVEILDPERMRQAERITIEKLRIPSLVLMEHAGRAVAEALLRSEQDLPARADEPVWVLCGPGHNGGDGFVAARHLARLGITAQVVLLRATVEQLDGDPRTMADAWVGLGGQVTTIADGSDWGPIAAQIDDGSVVIDALFGTGLARPLEGLAAQVVDDLNRSGAFVVAVDLPSGIDAARPAPIGPTVHADLTVTFARPKPAHLLPPVEQLSGELVVVDIGIPPRAVAATKPDLHWAEREWIAGLVPERRPDDHKGDFGHVLVVGGSVGASGAAALAGWGALQSGCGLVTVATAAPARAEIAGFAPELMTCALPAQPHGTIGSGAQAVVLERLALCDVLALGPGLGSRLGRDEVVDAEVRALIAASERPMVIDADALNAFAGQVAALASRRAPAVLTPHPGEAARLLGSSAADVQRERVWAARRIAELSDAVCVLKGYRTVIASPDGQCLINSTGNPGMATGGMGDALTGLIAGFLAQGLEPATAAALGVYLHGLAGDLAVEQGETFATLCASSLLQRIPDALRALSDAEPE